MKTSLVVQRCFTILFALLTFCLPFGLQAQSSIAKVGVVKNNVGVVTNLNEATRVLKGGLSANAVVSQITIDFSPSDNRYYLVGKISNDPVTGKAVRLNPDGPELIASIGPGVSVTCTGISCGSCMPEIRKYRPHCVCFDSAPGPNMECNMTSSATISF